MTQFSQPIVAELIVGNLIANQLNAVAEGNSIVVDPGEFTGDVAVMSFDIGLDRAARIIVQDVQGSVQPRLDLQSPEFVSRDGISMQLEAESADGTIPPTVTFHASATTSAGEVHFSTSIYKLLLEKTSFLTQGSGWIEAEAMRPTQVVETTNINNISDTTRVPGSTQCFTTFTAPPSGTILVYSFVAANSDVTGAVMPNFLELGWEIFEDDFTGAVFHASDIRESALITWEAGSSLNHHANREFMLGGLDAGRGYAIRTLHRVGGGSTIDINYRELRITPTT